MCALFAASCTFDPQGTGDGTAPRSRREDGVRTRPEVDPSIVEATAERIRSAVRERMAASEAGKVAEPVSHAPQAGEPAMAPIDRTMDASITQSPSIGEPEPTPAAQAGSGADASPPEMPAEDDAGIAEEDDAGVDPGQVDAGAAGSGAEAGGGGAAGVAGVSGVGGAAGESGAAGALGVGGEGGALGVGGEGGALGVGGEGGALGVGGEGGALGVGGEGGALGVGGEGGAIGAAGASGVGGAAGTSGMGGAGETAGGAAPSPRDREILLSLLELAITVIQNDPDVNPGDLLALLASATSVDPAVLAATLLFVDSAQNCDRRSDACVRVCELAARRCESCVEDATCRAALRGACGFEATECN